MRKCMKRRGGLLKTMKTIRTMSKFNKVWRLIQVFLFVSIQSYAFESNGISYYVESSNTVGVIQSNYTGIIEIPNTVLYNGVQYSVTTICNSAFANCSGLTSITIPQTITFIGSNAFENCSNLTSVYITDLALWFKISFMGNMSNPLYYAHHLFLNGEEVKDLVVPNSVTSIGNYVLDGCIGLTSVTIPNSVTSIGNFAFDGCTGLTSVTIPESVTSIGNNAFYGCSSLTSVHISDLAAWCRFTFNNSGSNPLSYAHHLYLNGEEVKDLVIPNSVTSIGSFAFDGCTGLTSVTIPNSVASIGANALYGCSSLTSVTIPNSVTSIGANAFYGCSSLTSVTIPSSVKSIGQYAFNNCSSLELIVSEITTPFSISNGAFSGIPSNAVLLVPKGTKNAYQAWRAYFKDIVEHMWEIEGFFVVNGIYYEVLGEDFSIGGIAVEVMQSPSGNSYSGNVTIPNTISYDGTNFTVTSIGKNAFYNSSGLISVTIPNSVNNIGVQAFLKCSSLTSVNIPNGITIIDESVFFGCSNLASISIPNSVEVIGMSAFYNCSSLTSITIPKSVTSIAGNAFYGCSGLSSIKVESGNPEYDSRNNCNGVIETATNALIIGCKNTVIPNTVTNIEGAFAGCSSLTTITIPSSVTNIEGAFSGCTGLTSITIPSSVKNTGLYTFQYCTSLSSVTLPNTLTSIGNYAFAACSSLTTITIPSSVISIGNYAFNNCSSLVLVVSEIASPSSISNYAFGGIPSNAVLHVPNGTVSAYQALSSWSTYFKEIVEVNSSYILSITASGNGFVTYNDVSFSNKTNSYFIQKGSTATLTFTPNLGYKIASVKVNNTDVTSKVSNNRYTISNISQNTIVVATFEAINYSLSVSASGGGSVTYDGTNITNGTQTFTVNEGSAVTLTFTCNTGNRLKSVKVNNTDVTSQVSNNKYTISKISQNTTVVVTFEAITYSLNISASGSGSISYNGTSIANGTQNFSVNEGSSVTLTFTPNSGYRLASVKVNNTDVTSQVSNNQFTISNISKNTTVEVAFQMISYSLSITSSAGGTISYNSVKVSDGTQNFSVNSGSSVTLAFTPNIGYRLASVKVNDTDVTSQVSNNQYTISNISQNTSVVVTFEAIPTYSLSITTSAGGTVLYNSIYVTNGSRSFSVYEGSSATMTITPNYGYRLVSVKVNDTDVTSQVLNNQYTISNITQNADVIVTFEEIPPLTYSLNISASVGGTVSYNSESVSEGTKTYYVNEGSSATLTITPNAGYRLASVKVNNTDVTSQVSNNKYTISNISQNTTVEVTFSAITHTLTVSASGYGVVTYQGNEVRNLNRSYSVNEGVSATISFAPDEGYRIASVKVNDVDVTSEVVDNQYVVSNIKEDIWIVVTFEEKPLQICSLTITASGEGSVSFNGESVNSGTSTYPVTEGSSATLVLTPGAGYRIASVKVNDVDVTLQVSNNQYTISKISDNTAVVVTFEAIPPQTYTLNISVLGGGSVSYDDKNVTNGTQTFTVNEGSAVTMTFVPGDGYRIASVKVNDVDVTSQVSNNQYTINNITANTTVVVTFEEIPIVTYSLSIAATGNGDVSYDGVTVKEQTSSFMVNEGTSATITITPGDGYRIASVKVNDVDVTTQVANNQYTISNITANTTVEVVFVEDIKALTNDGVNYVVVSYEDKTVKVSSGDYGLCLTVPTEFASNGFTWRVVGIDDDALSGSKDLAAVVWNPSVAFTARVENPNLLMYVVDKQYAPSGIQNVIVNGAAEEIILTDAESGNNFYCPQEFTASSINYAHRFEMMTGFGESRGWETIALPFDVQQVSDSKGKLLPFATWQTGGDGRPFWLYELDNSGWVMTGSIKANTPYIISMPNNERYVEEYCITGNVVFSASNAKVMTTDDLKSASSGEKTFIPNFMNKDKAASLYALNVDNEFENATGGYTEGSVFVKNLRRIHPFEAYMTVSGTNAKSVIAVFEDGTSGIRNIELLNIEGKKKVYNLSGQQIRLDENGRISHLRKGVYIIDGKKKVVK